MQIIIIIYLSVIGALLLYMVFLMVVDPFIRKPDAYTQPLHNEEESEVSLMLFKQIFFSIGLPESAMFCMLLPTIPQLVDGGN